MGFLQSDPRIYGVMQTETGSWYDKMRSKNYVSLFAPLMQRGFVCDPMDGRWRQPAPVSLNNQTPWCHQENAPKLHCGLDHTIIFNMFGIIPPRCLKCWKVCVTPHSFHELIQLEKLLADLDRPSKCGIEVRDYTPKHYGGYFYCDGFDHGRETYEVVRKALDENIELTDPEVPVDAILKRGCTEYEMIKGPSPYWNCSGRELDMVKLTEAFVDTTNGHTGQTKLQKVDVRCRWMLWAHANGDWSYLPYNGGKKLFPEYVTYHEGDIDAIKHDLCLTGMEGTTGMPPEITEEFLEKVSGFTEKHDIQNAGALTYALGNYGENGIELGILRTLPKEAVGEHDELT